MDNWKFYLAIGGLFINVGILLTVIIYVWKNRSIVKLSQQTLLKLRSNSEASAEAVNLSKKILLEMKTLRGLETSPVIMGFFDREKTENRDRLVFILQNIGEGIATDVTFTFTPELIGENEENVNNLVEFGKHKFVVPPNYQYKMMFGKIRPYLPSEYNEYENLPSEFLLTINCINPITTEALVFSYRLDLKKTTGVCQ